MTNTKDLNWLSAPAFFLIISLLAIHSIKQGTQTRHPEKVRPEITALPSQKPA
jgi:hypothetical protein